MAKILKETYSDLSDYIRDRKNKKYKTVMGEYKDGKLKSSSGKKVTNPKQAKAIAESYFKKPKK